MMDSKDGILDSETSSQDDDSGKTPHVGMEFDSEVAARTFYEAYASRIGFHIDGQYSRSKPDGPIVSCDFSCSREAFKRKNTESCNAMLKVASKNSGGWVVMKFVEGHNHSTSPSKAQYCRTHREFSGGTKSALKKVDNTDEPNHGYRNTSPAGANHHPQSSRWTYYVRPCTQKITLGKDSQSLLDYFKKMQAESPGFFYAIQLDDENRMTNIFWADARSRTAYSRFGDTVTFDTMYRPSMYQAPFAPFTGVNHHGQMVLFGCALILDESEASFIWLFKAWLSAMNYRAPASITTDQDRAIQAAVSLVLPQTRHCICKWHILREGSERLAPIYLSHPSFYAELYKCIDMSETVEEFELAWCSLLEKYSLHKNEWLEAVYNARRQWAPVFFRDTFFASISSNQGVKTFFDGYVNQQTAVPSFLKQYERALVDSLEREIKADYESVHTNPVLKTSSPMEQQTADQYTRRIFVKFQQELVETFAYTANKFEGDGVISKYRVAKYEDDHKAYDVSVNVSDMTAICSCHMFEYAGILCRHILTVFTVTNVLTVPSHYILRRWTKTPKVAIGLCEHNLSADLLGLEALTLRFTHLCQEGIKFAEVGSISLETYNTALSVLREGAEKMAIMKKTIVDPTPLGPRAAPASQEKSNKRSCLSMSEMTLPSLWPSLETTPRRFNLNDAGVAVADLGHASMTPFSGYSDGNPPDKMGVYKSMTWVMENGNHSTLSLKVAMINLKFQKHGKPTPGDTDVQFRVTKATLEPMLRSMAYVSQQLCLPTNKTAVISLKLQDTKTTSGETELKFQVSQDNLAGMLKAMTSLHEQL